MIKKGYEEENFEDEDKEDTDEDEAITEEELERKEKLLKSKRKEIESLSEREPRQAKGKWILQHIPEVFRVVNPETKEVVVQAYSLEELRVQLEMIAAQKATETAKDIE